MAGFRKEIKSFFPNCRNLLDFKETSDRDQNYNCIAWAAKDDTRVWWPTPAQDFYWPDGFSRENSVENFLAVFASFGFVACDSGKLEKGIEKLVLYLSVAGLPTHMARQLPTGKWTSKLGGEWDISHATPELLAGSEYGKPSIYLCRKT